MRTYWIVRYPDGTFDANPGRLSTMDRSLAYAYLYPRQARPVAGKRWNGRIIRVTVRTHVAKKRRTRAGLEALVESLQVDLARERETSQGLRVQVASLERVLADEREKSVRETYRVMAESVPLEALVVNTAPNRYDAFVKVK